MLALSNPRKRPCPRGRCAAGSSKETSLAEGVRRAGRRIVHASQVSGSALTAIYFLLLLKIPVIGMIALLYWVSRSGPADEPEKVPLIRPREKGPRRPRRGGPHGAPPDVLIQGQGRTRKPAREPSRMPR